MGFADGFVGGFGVIDKHYRGKEESKFRQDSLAQRDRERADDVAYREGVLKSQADDRAAMSARYDADREIARKEAESLAEWRATQAKASAEELRMKQADFDFRQKQQKEFDQAHAADRAWKAILQGGQPDPSDDALIKGSRFDYRRFADPKLGEAVDIGRAYLEGQSVDPAKFSESAARLLEPMINSGKGEKATGVYAGKYEGWVIENKTLDGVEPIKNQRQGKYGGGDGLVQANVRVQVKDPKTGETGFYLAPVTVGRQTGGVPNPVSVDKLVDYWAGNAAMYEAIRQNPQTERYFNQAISQTTAKDMAQAQSAAEAQWNDDRRRFLDNNRQMVNAGYRQHLMEVEESKRQAEMSGQEGGLATDSNGNPKMSREEFTNYFAESNIGTRTDYVNSEIRKLGIGPTAGEKQPYLTSQQIAAKYQPFGVRSVQDGLDLHSLFLSRPILRENVKALAGEHNFVPTFDQIERYKVQLSQPITEQNVAEMTNLINQMQREQADRMAPQAGIPSEPTAPPADKGGGTAAVNEKIGRFFSMDGVEQAPTGGTAGVNENIANWGRARFGSGK